MITDHRAELVSALTGRTRARDRIYPLARTKGTQLPAIVYSWSEQFETDICGLRSLTEAQATVSVIAETYTQAQIIAREVIALVDQAEAFEIIAIDDSFDVATETFAAEIAVIYQWQQS